MLLGEYVASLPFGSKTEFRKRLAEAHGCSVSLVRKWENDPPPADWSQDKVRRMSCRHPPDLSAVEKTEAVTGFNVTRSDLRPECFPKSEASNVR